MYYLTGNKHGVKYGVIDTSDGVEDYLSIPELLSAEHQGFKIYGLIRNHGYLYCFGVNESAIKLLRCDCPVPVRLRLAKGLGYVQTVYIGYRVRSDLLEFIFFDDSGMSGLCILTNIDLKSDGVDLDFDHVDTRRRDILLKRLKDSGSFLISV